MAENVTGISLNGVRKLIEDRELPESIFDAVDSLIGVALALSPVVLGPVALPLWTLIEPKNELVAAAKDAVKKITKSEPRDYLGQARNLAVANCLLTYTAHFDALALRLPEFTREVKLTEADKQAILRGGNRTDVNPIGTGDDLAGVVISVRHPADAVEQFVLRLSLSYREATELGWVVDALRAMPGPGEPS